MSHGQILRMVLARPAHRRLIVLAALAYLLIYLLAVGHLAVDPAVAAPQPPPAVVVVPDWPARLVKPVSRYGFEPLAALYPLPGVVLLLAPPNLLLGALLGGLVGLNLATAAHALSSVRSCRRVSWLGLVGSFPGLLTGFACCAPTLALVLGLNVSLALISLQGFLLPVSLALLAGGVAWNLHRTRRELLQAG